MGFNLHLCVLSVLSLVVSFTGCSQTSDGAGGQSVAGSIKSPVLKVAVIDEFRLLTEGINPSLPFLESVRGLSGVTKAVDSAPAEFNCQDLKMGKHGTALLWDPKAFKKGQNLALSSIAHAGYFATVERAARKISDLSGEGGLNATLCQGSKTYALNLTVTSLDVQGNRIIFETTRKEGLVYQSKIRVLVDMKWGSVEGKFGSKERTLEFYSLEKLSLDTDAGNGEAWVFERSTANEAVLKQNLQKYLQAHQEPGDEWTAADGDKALASVPAARCTSEAALSLKVDLRADLVKAFGRLDVTSESSFDFEVRRFGVLVEKKTKETTWRVGVGSQYFREFFDLTQDGRYSVIVTPKLPVKDEKSMGDFPEPGSKNIALLGSASVLKSSTFDFVVRNIGSGPGCTLELLPFSSAEKNGVTVTLSVK